MFTTNSKLNFECGMRSGYVYLNNENSFVTENTIYNATNKNTIF